MTKYLISFLVVIAQLCHGWTSGAWPATNYTGREIVNGKLVKEWWILNCWSGTNERTWQDVDGYVDIMADRTGIVDIGAYIQTNRRAWVDLLISIKDDALLWQVESYINQEAYISFPPSSLPTNGWEMWTPTGIAVSVGASNDFWNVTRVREYNKEMQHVHDIIVKMKYSVREPKSIKKDIIRNEGRWDTNATYGPLVLADTNFCTFSTFSIYTVPVPPDGSGDLFVQDNEESDYFLSDDSSFSVDSYLGWAWVDPHGQISCDQSDGEKELAYALRLYTNMPTVYFMAYRGPFQKDTACDMATNTPSTLVYSGDSQASFDMYIAGLRYAHSAFIHGPSALTLNSAYRLMETMVPDEVSKLRCMDSDQPIFVQYETYGVISEDNEYILRWDFNYD